MYMNELVQAINVSHKGSNTSNFSVNNTTRFER